VYTWLFGWGHCPGTLLLFVLYLVDEQSPHLDHEDLRLLVENHLDVLEDGLGFAPRQHLRADEVRQGWFWLSDVLCNLLVDPGTYSLLHKLVVHQVPVHAVGKQSALVRGNLLDERLDVLPLVISDFSFFSSVLVGAVGAGRGLNFFFGLSSSSSSMLKISATGSFFLLGGSTFALSCGCGAGIGSGSGLGHSGGPRSAL